MSAKPKKATLDPFCLRDSFSIALDVVHLATRVMANAEAFCMWCQTLRTFNEDPYMQHKARSLAATIPDRIQRLKVATAELEDVYRKLWGWWIPDQPPAVDPVSTSVLESLLLAASMLIESYEQLFERVPTDVSKPDERPPISGPIPSDLTPILQFIELEQLKIDLDRYWPAMTCETAVMTRRPRPNKNLLKWRNTDAGGSFAADEYFIKEMVRDRVEKKLRTISPDSATREEMSKRINARWWTKFPNGVSSEAAESNHRIPAAFRPGSGVEPTVLCKARQEKILSALDGKNMKGETLIKYLEEREGVTIGKNIYTSWGLNHLRQTGRVVNDLDFGYLRPDRPPKGWIAPGRTKS